jgi:hypothetical protein
MPRRGSREVKGCALTVHTGARLLPDLGLLAAVVARSDS